MMGCAGDRGLMAKGGRLLSALLPLFLAGTAAQAQELLTAGEKEVVNYAFATQLGSGVYSVSGRLIQVYRLPFSYRVREEAPGDWGLRVTFPMTVGIYDFHAVDVVETGLPEHMDSASLVPGVEFRVPVLKDWLLKPYAEAGVGREHSGNADFRIVSGGIRSLADFHPGNFTLALGNTLVYARVEPADDQPADDLFLLETGLEARHGLGEIRGNPMGIGFYGVLDFQNDPGFPAAGGAPTRYEDQYEVGVTYGPRESARLWKIPIPRIGFGWRFGEDLSVLRLVIGLPCQSLQR